MIFAKNPILKALTSMPKKKKSLNLILNAPAAQQEETKGTGVNAATKISIFPYFWKRVHTLSLVPILHASLNFLAKNFLPI